MQNIAERLIIAVRNFVALFKRIGVITGGIYLDGKKSTSEIAIHRAAFARYASTSVGNTTTRGVHASVRRRPPLSKQQWPVSRDLKTIRSTRFARFNNRFQCRPCRLEAGNRSQQPSTSVVQHEKNR
ncbi:hypothetical protein HN011_004542 [Eciton burchellii]|nr:hypothetical protein HN011_004542 [Eciton burchellii]